VSGPDRPSVMDDSIEGALQRNDAIRVLALALASNGWPATSAEAAAVLRDIEEGGYTLRLTTRDERSRKNSEHGPSR
jgi:hypothetical protein